VGAANALKVYAAWSHLDDRPLRLLAYMALVARDNDAAPWFGLGQEALAELALGQKPSDASMRAVRRAVTALRDAGAICTAKRATYGKRGTTNVRYRLHLECPCDCKPPDAQRPMDNHPGDPVDNPSPPDGERPMDGSGHRTVSDLWTTGHRTVSDLNPPSPPDAERPTKEEIQEEVLQLQERSSSKANLRNGELWKAGPLDAAEPSGEQMSQNGHKPSALERAAWRTASRRTLDQTSTGETA
jgi:hypothetical protein